MMIDQARVSLVARRNGAPGCELCTARTNPANTSVVIQHSRGGTIELGACDWCVQALRRLAAASGGHVEFSLADGAIPAPASPRIVPGGARPVGPAALVLEFAEPVRDPADGTAYITRAYGRARADGTWEGWLEFVGVEAEAGAGAAVVLRTDEETSQSNREGVAYWASGLQPTYLEGAFARARRDTRAAM